MPPVAASAGPARAPVVLRCPSSTSLFNSRPMSRKKKAIKPSLTHRINGRAAVTVPIWRATGR